MTSGPRSAYSTPAAFRRALTDKLRAIASPHGLWKLPDLQRQLAYDRLLVRLYMLDDGWIVKGATALLARRIAVRHTIDLDVYRAAGGRRAERDLRAALALDAEDWFAFEAGSGRSIADGTNGIRIPVDARIGATTWASFHVDVVAEGVQMTGQSDPVPSLVEIAMAGFSVHTYRAYPLVDHIADKTCAILERRGDGQRPSTRFKDLVDLVVLTAHARPSAEAQRTAFMSETRRRGIVLPHRFDVPDVKLWEAGYAAEARRASKLPARTLADALAQVRSYIEPVLAENTRGVWDTERRLWT